MYTDKVKGFEPYIPFEYNSGQIRMDCNESPFPLPELLKAEIKKEIGNIDFNRYPDPYAKGLINSFCDYYDLKKENVIAGNGSDELLSLILSILPFKGSKIATIRPDFSMYSFYSYLGENENLVYEQKEHCPDVDDISSFIENNKTDLMIFSNPRNPTGAEMSRESVLKMCERCKDCIIVVDEAYMDFSDQSVLQYAGSIPNLIVLKTLSKSFGLAAQRVGFAVGPVYFIDSLRTVKSPYNLNSLSQSIGKIVLDNKEIAKKNLDKIISYRNDLYDKLRSLERDDFKVMPTRANFVYVSTDKADMIYTALLAKNIVVRRFKNALRITASWPEDNEYLIECLKDGILS